MRRFVVPVIIAILVFIAFVSGCGGGSGGPKQSNYPPASTRTAQVRFSIHWGERGRAVTAPSSALSAVLTLVGANPDGSDFTFIQNRSQSSPSDYLDEIVTPTVARVGLWEMRLRFFAQPNGAGDEVGVAGSVITLIEDGSGIGDVNTEGRIKSVAIAPAQTIVAGQNEDLVVTCRDAAGEIVSVTPASFHYQVSPGADNISNVQVVGGQLQGSASGEDQVSVNVDGQTSANVDILVTGGDDSNPDVTVVKPNVRLIPNDVQFTKPSEDSLRLSGNVPAIAPGDVIVSRVENGYLRRVLFVQPDGDGILVQTEQAALTDIFDQVNFSTPTGGQDIDYVLAESPPEGITPSLETRSRAPGEFTFESSFDFLDVILVGDKNNPAVKLTGKIKITGKTKYDLSIRRGRLEHFLSEQSLKAGTTLTLGAPLSTKGIQKKFKALKLNSRSPLFIVLGIPVYPELDINVNLSGDLEQGFQFGPGVSTDIRCGAEYTKGPGWSPIAEVNSTVEPISMPELPTSFTARLTPLQPEVRFKLFDVVGPKFAADAPFFELKYEPANPAPGQHVSVSMGASVTGGIIAKLFGLIDLDFSYEQNVINPKIIFEKTFGRNPTPPGSNPTPPGGNPTPTPTPTVGSPTPTPTPSNSPYSGDTSSWSRLGGNNSNNRRRDAPPSNGILRWKFNMGDPIRTITSPKWPYTYMAPIVGKDGTVYVGNKNHLFAIDGSSGQQKWTSDFSDWLSSTPALSPDGVLYFSSSGGFFSDVRSGFFRAVDSVTGSTKWTIPAEQPWGTSNAWLVTTSPLIGTNGSVFVTNESGLIGLNPQTGATTSVNSGAFTFSPDNPFKPTLTADGNFVSWDFFTGDIILSNYQTNAVIGRIHTNEFAAYAHSTGIGSDGTIYVSFKNSGNVYAINGSDGKLKWLTSIRAGTWFGTDVAVSNGALYVGDSFNGRLYALSTDTGNVMWEYAVGAMSSPAIGPDGTVFVAGEGGYLYALR